METSFKLLAMLDIFSQQSLSMSLAVLAEDVVYLNKFSYSCFPATSLNEPCSLAWDVASSRQLVPARAGKSY